MTFKDNVQQEAWRFSDGVKFGKQKAKHEALSARRSVACYRVRGATLRLATKLVSYHCLSSHIQRGRFTMCLWD